MSLYVYKVLHLLGIFLLFAALGGLVLRRIADRGATPARDAASRLAGATHGIALILLLVSGFGLLAKLGLALPAWAVAKLVIWLLMGALVVVIRRSTSAGWLWWALPALGVLAAWLAIYKPVW